MKKLFNFTKLTLSRNKFGIKDVFFFRKGNKTNPTVSFMRGVGKKTGTKFSVLINDVKDLGKGFKVTKG